MDIYNEIDKDNILNDTLDVSNSSKDTALAVYTLIDNDYALSTTENVKKYKNFSESLLAKDLIPEILMKKNWFHENGFETRITYNYYRGYSDEIIPYKTTHEVTENEYEKVNDVVKSLNFFTSNHTFTSNIVSILTASYPSAVKNDLYRVKSLEANKSIDAVLSIIMVDDDYQIIVDSVKADTAIDHFVSSYGNSELYYGANAYYKNFEIRTTKWKEFDEYKNLSDDAIEDTIYNRQKQAFQLLLKAKYPEAKINDAASNKITYVIKYVVYDGDSKR